MAAVRTSLGLATLHCCMSAAYFTGVTLLKMTIHGQERHRRQWQYHQNLFLHMSRPPRHQFGNTGRGAASFLQTSRCNRKGFRFGRQLHLSPTNLPTNPRNLSFDLRQALKITCQWQCCRHCARLLVYDRAGSCNPVLILYTLAIANHPHFELLATPEPIQWSQVIYQFTFHSGGGLVSPKPNRSAASSCSRRVCRAGQLLPPARCNSEDDGGFLINIGTQVLNTHWPPPKMMILSIEYQEIMEITTEQIQQGDTETGLSKLYLGLGRFDQYLTRKSVDIKTRCVLCIYTDHAWHGKT